MKSTIILSAILSLFRFGDHVLFSLRNKRLEVVGARKNGARERDTRIFSRARSALYVAGTCFTTTFPQLRSPPPSCQPREKWCFSQKQREVIFDLPRQLPPKVREMTASSNSPPFGPKGWTCPCGCPRDSNKSYWTVRQNDILQNQKPLSLFSPNCVPPFRCCFRFLLKVSALKKFTTTGAGYGLLT